MDAEVWTALAAVITAIASALMGYAAVLSAKRKADGVCEDRLASVRAEAEHAADELHELRMRRASGE